MICEWCGKSFPKRKGRFCGTCYPPERQANQLKLWEAIHRYVVACGGDPGKTGDGPAREAAVVEIEGMMK